MQLERLRPSTYRITLSAYELAALVSAARWVVDGAKGELSPEATVHLSQILSSYDEASEGVNKRNE